VDEQERATREWPCPYLAITADGGTELPLGFEFQQLVALFSKNTDMLRGIALYLKGLQAILDDNNSTDDERETAERACSKTVVWLRAVLVAGGFPSSLLTRRMAGYLADCNCST
jgi:hypothetical protein